VAGLYPGPTEVRLSLTQSFDESQVASIFIGRWVGYISLITGATSLLTTGLESSHGIHWTAPQEASCLLLMTQIDVCDMSSAVCKLLL
jgi:hypothetical protein